MSAGLRRGASLVLWSVVGSAAVAVVWVLPAFVQFARSAPDSFWALAVCALVVDAPLFFAFRREDPRARPTFSVLFVFSIFAIWGGPAAIVVQAVAGTVSALGQRSRPRQGVFFVARLVLAPVVTELVLGARRVQYTEPGGGVTNREILEGLLLVLVWVAVSAGLLVLSLSVTQPGWPPAARDEVFKDVLRTSASVLIGGALLTTVTGWWPLFAALPILVWNWLTRARWLELGRLSREPASGLLNRQGLELGLHAITAHDFRAAPPRRCGVIMASLPAVMAIGERLGRDLSELVLRQVAQRLVHAYGDDRVGQLSPESLVVLVPDMSEESALADAESVLRVLTPPVEVDQIPFVLDPVVGVALRPRDGEDLSTLLVKAGLAASHARREGEGTQLYVHHALTSTQRRLMLLRELRATLLDPARHGEIAIVYQPQIELATGRLSGVEALLRWRHPELGKVRTDELIEAVEQSGVMHLLTRHVLTTVAGQLARWNAQGMRLRASVNISVQDVHEPGFLDEIRALVRDAGIGPGQLTIEITERMLLTDSVRVMRAARALSELGVGLSLDDFGRGHASLAQLRLLPLTEVKIDQSYVARMVEDPADRAIVTSVHQLARALGVTAVAEGVESVQVARALAGLVGMVGQGYYLGMPMPADALLPHWQPPALPHLTGAAGRRRAVRRRPTPAGPPSG